MRNVWIQTEYPAATWVADLTSIRAQPAELVEAIASILSAGARHRVFLSVSLPELGFERDRDGDPTRFLLAQWTERRVVNAFGFTGLAMAPDVTGSSTVEAEVAWFDRDDSIVVGPTANLGAVLRGLEPVPGSIADAFTVPFPPVRITGLSLPYEGEPPTLATSRASRRVEVRIAVHSTIWFPYVFGSAHPLADFKRQFDNRTLARLHTPRLNEFLRDVAAVTNRAGGGWKVDLDETTTEAQRWLDTGGIHVDAEPPALFPSEAFAAEWF